MCGLNAHKLREERARRAEYLELLRDTPVRIKSDDVVAAKKVYDAFSEEVHMMIPAIKYITAHK